MEAILCKNIWKAFGEGSSRVEALKGIDLEIQKGEIRMLMGPSGSGKTTLISIIAGILTEDKGECWIEDVQLNQLSNGEKTRFRGLHIGFVFQAFNLIPSLTIEENISIPLILNNIKRETAITAAKEIMRELGIEDKIGSLPEQLSGGQQQRAAIARAMIHQPKLIVCDEPTSHLDIENGLKIMSLLHDLIKKNKATLIVVTHDTRITHFADRIDRLEDGKIIAMKENNPL